MAAPAGLTCLKEAAAGRPVACKKRVWVWGLCGLTLIPQILNQDFSPTLPESLEQEGTGAGTCSKLYGDSSVGIRLSRVMGTKHAGIVNPKPEVLQGFQILGGGLAKLMNQLPGVDGVLEALRRAQQRVPGFQGFGFEAQMPKFDALKGVVGEFRASDV